MIQIPDPARIITLLASLEGNGDAASSAAQLFWIFWHEAKDFSLHADWLAEAERITGGQRERWTTSEMAHLMSLDFRDPGALIENVWSRVVALETLFDRPYEPDADRNFEVLVAYIHVAAAKAVALKRRDGYFEDVRYLINRVWATSKLLDAQGARYSVDPDLPLISAYLTSAVLAVDMFTIRTVDAEYEDALNTLAEGLRVLYWSNARLDEAVKSSKIGPASASGKVENQHASPLLVSWLELAKLNVRMLHELPFEPRVVIACCEQLKSDARVTDAVQLEKDFRLLGSHSASVDDDTDFDVYQWEEFWNRALGWVEAQLSSGEFKDIIREREDERAEERLRKYFFGLAEWERIPSRAKRSLVDADRKWLSSQAGRPEAIFNDLRIATEEIVHRAFWTPLVTWYESSHSDEEARRLHGRLAWEPGKQPDLFVLERLCHSQEMEDFLISLNTEVGDRRFICEQLPSDMRRLREARREAEHMLGRTWELRQASELFGSFLGIGRGGILPRLLDVSSRLDRPFSP